MFEYYIQQGQKNFCISSSGNAALAAAIFVKNYNQTQSAPIQLKIFVGKHIAPHKLTALQEVLQHNKQITLESVQNPKQSAFMLDKNGVAKNLRQSTDNLALSGYHTLAKELSLIQNLSAVFVPTSSGTTAQGLFEGFKKIGINPQIHIIQTPKCHPFINNSITGPSVADAIVDTIGYRKQQIQTALAETHGAGWIATDEKITQILGIIADHHISDQGKPLDVSANSALSLAGLALAIEHDWQFTGPVACLITGK
jgi:threonine dehydratase